MIAIRSNQRRRRDEKVWFKRRVCGVILANLTAICISFAGVGDALENYGRDVRDLLASRNASGDVVLVAIDGSSLKSHDHWPWSRSIYAKLIQRLNDAGVAKIAFDVDFSARTDAEGDRLFSEAIKSSQATVILSTFKQRDLQAQSGFIESLPIPMLRTNSFLAAVNVHPDADGILRSYGFGEQTGGLTRPSMGAMLADKSGRLGTNFVIDQSIDPRTIPNLSVSSVLSNDFAPSTLRGKTVLIGATAIELGDRYAVPLHGTQPGPVVQIQAAETLLIGRPLQAPIGFPVTLVSFIFLIFLAHTNRWQTRFLGLAIGYGLIVVLCSFLEIRGAAAFKQIPALFQFVLSAGVLGVLDFLGVMRQAQRSEARTGLPNGLALAEKVENLGKYYVVSARFPRLTEALSILREEDRGTLLIVIADRLRLHAGVDNIYLDGGDTFCWSYAKTFDSPEAEAMFSAIADLFHAPIPIGGRPIAVTPCLGVAYGVEGDVVGTIARAANAADRAARNEKLWAVDDGSLALSSVRRQRLLGDMASSLATGDFWIAYQAKMDVGTSQIIGAEALMRWSHADFGQISPGEFIPLFEAEKIMLAPTLFVLDMVIKDIETWRESGLKPNIAINISSTLLVDLRFIDEVQVRLSRYPAICPSLTFEVTESAAISNGDNAFQILTSWRESGIRVSIDDYGTGQSTLSYLRNLPANEIKIDQSFVRGLVSNTHDQVLVRSTVELAHALGMKVVAEGVEDEAILRALKLLKCDVVQGWHIGRPVDAETFMGALQGATV